MFCQNCGTENPKEARFCQKCGKPLAVEPGGDTMGEETAGRQMEVPQGTAGKAKKKNGLKWLLIPGAVLLVAVCATGVLVIRGHQERRDYENYVASAQKYLEELDYESAEDAYLQAIAVDPKKAEAYIGLADTYLKQEDFDKAGAILSKGQKEVSKEEAKKISSSGAQSSDGASGGTSINDQIEALKVGKNYTWMVEPETQADDIYYLKDENAMDYCGNDLNRQMDTGYAVIKQEDSFGLVGLDGRMGAELEYQGVSTLSKYYLLERKEPEYEPEYDTEMTDYYFIEEEESVEPAVAVIGDAGSYFRGTFYYCDGLHNTAEYDVEQGYALAYQQKPERAIPVKQSESVYDGDQAGLDWYDGLDSNYAVCSPAGTLLTDFIYEECGSVSSGLLAVKKDGKWGYVNEQGEVVIPLEYDASCRYETYVFSYDTEGEPETVEYCYAASDGYVPLCKNGRWELRDASGTLVIPAGIFDTIRPVYDGQCWVKKDGKWGVIQITEKEGSEKEGSAQAESEAWKEAYTSYIESIQAEGWAGYRLIYIDDDDIPELYITGNSTAQGDMICTMKGSRVNAVPMGNYGVTYFEREKLFLESGGRMDTYYDNLYRMEDGEIVKLHEGRYGAEDNTNVRTDAEGNPIYQYFWDGNEVSEGDYEKELKSVFDRDYASYAGERSVSASEMLRQIENY